MFRLYNPKKKQTDFIEASLPRELFELDEELRGVDELLDEEDLLAPFLEDRQTERGRPTIPLETYLRMMYLKYRHELGYRPLVHDVSDRIKWRTFCRLKLSDPVPAVSTLKETTRRYGEELVRGAYDTVLGQARERKILRRPRPRRDAGKGDGKGDGEGATGEGATDEGNRWAGSFTSLRQTVKTLQAAGSKAVKGLRGRGRDMDGPQEGDGTGEEGSP